LTFNVCPRTCQVTTSMAKQCEALDMMVCPVRITMNIVGSAPTTSIDGMQFKATLRDYKVEQHSQEITDTLAANKRNIQPMMQKGLDLGLDVANKMIVEQTRDFENAISKVMEQGAIKKYAWISKVLLGANGFAEGVTAAMHKRFKEIGAEMFTRSEVDIKLDDSNKEKLCHRLLRITPPKEEGEPYYIKDWKNALVARKYDEKTNCNTAYVAHCGSGTMVKTKKCPCSGDRCKTHQDQEPEVTKRCLFSMFCWKGTRKIQGGPAKVSTLYKGDVEMKVRGDVRIDHVAGKDVRSNMPFSQVVVQAADADEMAPEKLDTLVQIRDDKLPRVLRDEVCQRVRANSWRVFGGLKSLRCRLALRGMLRLGSLGNPKVNIGKPTEIDMDVSGGVFTANFIPEWKGIAQVAEKALFDQLKGEKFPFNGELESLNLKMDGDGETLNFEVTPVLYGKISAEELKELGRSIHDNQDVLPPQR